MSDLEEVRRIVVECLRGHPARVWLFGSFARGTPARTSDIDVAVLPFEPLPTGLLTDVRDRLEAQENLACEPETGIKPEARQG
jgi:predicted nucleotidyltransferase